MESILRHFYTLSFSRKIGQFGPLPIDIPSMLEYNKHVAKLDPADFLALMQSLDEVYLKQKPKEETKLV
jgi:hypothetical protein